MHRDEPGRPPGTALGTARPAAPPGVAPAPTPRPRSFRRRVAVLTSGAVVLAVLALTVAMLASSRRALLAEVDATLTSDASVITRFVASAGEDEVAAALADIDALGADPQRLRDLLRRGAGPFRDRRDVAPAPPPPDGFAGRERRFLDVLQGTGDPLGGATGVGRLIDAEGEVLLPGLDGLPSTVVADERDRAVAAGTTRRPALRTVELDRRDLRLLTVPIVDGVALQVARPLDEVRDVQARLTRTAVLVGGVAAVLAGLAGVAVAQRVVEPVARLRRSVARVAATGDLDQHLDVQADDELTALASTFNDMLDSLAHARRTQRQLVADASHELRTPLTSLRTNIEVLELDRLAADDRRELLADVREQLVELGGLVDGLVTLARGDAGDAELVPLRLDDVVAEVVARARTNRRGVEVRLTATPTTILGARDEVARAVANLVDNAAKYGGTAGPVDVVVGAAQVQVRDRGPGIDERDREHVFDRFYRAIRARSRPGSGLGLAIVAQTAASHGGAVHLEHPEDGGLVVLLRFRPA